MVLKPCVAFLLRLMQIIRAPVALSYTCCEWLPPWLRLEDFCYRLSPQAEPSRFIQFTLYTVREHNPDGRTMALVLTQSLNRNEYQEYFLGLKAAGAYVWQPYHLLVPIIMKSWSLNLLEPSRVCLGLYKNCFAFYSYIILCMRYNFTEYLSLNSGGVGWKSNLNFSAIIILSSRCPDPKWGESN
jgi:hypothetical protein